MIRGHRSLVVFALACALTPAFATASTSAPGTVRASSTSQGLGADRWSDWPETSSDGRFVTFASVATNLDARDHHQNLDVYLRDAAAGTTTLVSAGVGGAQSDGTSVYGAPSDDGRYVTFISDATNLVPADANGRGQDIFLHDVLTGVTEIVSVSSQGVQGSNPNTFAPDIHYADVSADGRWVAFSSPAPNLVSGDGNGEWDVFLRDRATGTTTLVSRAIGGGSGRFYSGGPVISRNGRFVTFHSFAPDLVPGDTNGTWDSFVYDRVDGTLELVSLTASGGLGNGMSLHPDISEDGRFVTFMSHATNLIPGDTNGWYDVFVRDRQAQVTELVSVAPSGAQGDGPSGPSTISGDGTRIAFDTFALNFGGAGYGVWVRDRAAGSTTPVSVDVFGRPTTAIWGTISADGRSVAFVSQSPLIVVPDTNTATDPVVAVFGAVEHLGSIPFPDPVMQGRDVFVRRLG